MPFLSLPTTLRTLRSTESLGCMLLVAAVFAGKLGLGRLLPGAGQDWWLEFRLWTLLASVALLWRQLPLADWASRLSPGLVALAALVGVMWLRGAADPSGAALSESFDLLHLLAQALVVAMATRRHLIAMGLWAIAMATALFLLAAMGVSQPELNGEGWAPIGGPTTFYRIEFLAFCLCWAFYAVLGRRYWPFAALSAVFLYGALASLSKVAIPGAAIVLLAYTVRHLLRRDWLGMACIAGVVLGVFSVWQVTMSDSMGRRLDRATMVRGDPQTASGLARKDQDAGGSDALKRVEVAPRVGTDFEVRMSYCVGAAPDAKAADKDSPVCQTRTFVDRSSRLLFAAEAIRGIASEPLWGHGLSTFVLHMPNPQSGLPETYTYPHNLVLEVAFETGAVGTLLLLAAMVLLVRDCLRSAAGEPAASYHVAGYLCFIFLSTLVSGDFYDSRLMWLVALALIGYGAKRGEAARQHPA